MFWLEIKTDQFQIDLANILQSIAYNVLWKCWQCNCIFVIICARSKLINQVRFNWLKTNLIWTFWTGFFRIVSYILQIDVDKYRAFCKETSIMVLRFYKWVYFSRTVHGLLAHSADLIANNGGRGLKVKSEQGLEHNNKCLRMCR